MIRINLLPDTKRQVSTGGGAQLWGVIYLLAAFAWGVVLFLVYLKYNAVLEEQLAKNNALQQDINRVTSQSADIGDIEAKLAKSRQLEEVVTGLQQARQGPASVLMELSKVLSEGAGPTVDPDKLETLRRENPLLVYNPGWDIRRLWLKGFSEQGGKCDIKGYGKTNEDVAEFLRRLSLSDTFDAVTLQKTTFADKDGLPVVDFSLTCEVKY